MIDREYEIIRIQMRERERHARQQQLVRRSQEGEAAGWLGRLLLALRGASASGEARRAAAKKVLEPDGTLSCPEPGLVHRPWRDPLP